MKKMVLMAAIPGLSLTLLFAQNPDANTQQDALEVLREKRMQLNNPQSVTQSKIFLLQQKDFEAKAEAAKARAEEARNRAKAARNKSAEPPTASEKANRPAYDQRRLELAAEQAEAEAEAAQAEADAVQAQVEALKAKVEASKAKAEEVRTSPYRRAQSKYYDAQWQEQLEKKTLQEQAQVSKDAVLKTRIAAEALKRAQFARDTARKHSMAMAAKKSGVPVVAQDTKANDEEMARRAHELELAQAKAEKEAADAREQVKKSQEKAPKAKVTQEVAIAKSTPAPAHIAPTPEVTKPTPDNSAALAKEQARQAELEAQAIRKQKEEVARQAKALEEEQAKQAKELQKQQAKQAREAEKAKKKQKAPAIALRSAPVDPSEVENEVQGLALAALRRKQADLDVQEGVSKSTATATTVAPTPEAKTSVVTAADSTPDAQAKALEALRRKQADLDAQEAQATATATSAKERAKTEAKRPTEHAKKVSATPANKAEELELAARSTKTETVERAVAPVAKVDTAAIDAESKKLQELRQKQADLRAQQIKLKTDLQEAVRNASEKKSKTDEGLELIVDNPAARPTGTWMNGKTRGYYGADYIWKGKGTGANYVKFVPVIPVAGEYEVYEWHVPGTNRASDAPYIISYNGGTQTILVNQQINGSKWNLLGKFNFAQGSSGEIRITDGISTAGQMVMADAVRFVSTAAGSTGSVAEAPSKEVEDLRKQQADLDAELTKLKEEIAATDKHLAELKEAAAKAPAQVIEQPAVTVTTQKPQPTTHTAAKSESKKPVAKKTESELTAEATAVLSPKEQKLADLLQRYKKDEITPHEYHQMRAKIIAEP